MKTTLLFLLITFGITFVSVGQNTYVPDDNFEQALIDLGYDTPPLNNYVPTANINTVIALQIPNKNISDLAGIEDFAALTILQCNDNQLTSLDLSNNPNLDILICNKNQLTSLNVSNNAALRRLQCNENSLTSLELPSSNTLIQLWCYQNQLENLDVTNNTALFDLSCQQNQLTSLDVSKNTALITLYCGHNELNSIDVSNNTSLTYFECIENQISSLNLSNNPLLEHLLCNYNQLTILDVSKNLYLNQLWCGNNQLSSLDVTNNTFLRIFSGINNQLSSIHISHMPKLERIELINNQLISLDLSNNVLLQEVYCEQNNLTNLVVDNCTTLESIYCNENQLTGLDVSSCPSLLHLACYNNQLTSIDVSHNLSLTGIRCFNNKLTHLDVSQNLNLNELSSMNNLLESLNVRNGNNLNFLSFATNNNPNLTCIQVDDAAWSTSNWHQIDSQMYFSENCGGGAYTLIPDNNFEQALIDLGLDDVLNGKVLTASIDTVTKLDVSYKDISNLTGIEDFVALKFLGCVHNQLTSLDVSKNLALVQLGCGNNQLSSIDVTKNTLLWDFTSSHNQLTSISCSNMPNLEHIEVSANQLVSLDLTNNVSLQEVGCVGSNLTYLIVDNCTSLKTIHCNYNQITSLDVSSCPSIEFLGCYNNQLTSIDVSHNLALTSLGCFYNKITHLDVSNNIHLDQLGCNNNLLESLNVKNGNNVNFSYFAAGNNTMLTCIKVDDPAWAEANWIQIDSHMLFATNCGATGDDSDGDGVPDDFEDYPMDDTRAFNNLFPAAGNGSLAFEDLWPGMGDYDFNDVVVDYRFKTVTNASNKVVEVYAQFVLKASGASLRNGFGFNLPNASSNLISQLTEVKVTGCETHSNYISLHENGFEANQSKPTVIVFDDFFEVMEHPGLGLGINTESDKPFVTFDTLTLLIKPTSAMFTMADFQLELWNPFVVVNGERGKEIHLPNKAPTDLVDLGLFGTYEDTSNLASGRYYKTANNLPWAINIVSEFTWPIEKVSIVDAYSHFFDWAKSSGAEYGDWYENKTGYRVSENLYAVPVE